MLIVLVRTAWVGQRRHGSQLSHRVLIQAVVCIFANIGSVSFVALGIFFPLYVIVSGLAQLDASQNGLVFRRDFLQLAFTVPLVEAVAVRN